MTRATRFAASLAGVTLIYVLLILDIIPTPLINHEAREEILPTLPWWSLVAFGSYLLWSMGWGIFHFNNVPEAYDELMMDIKAAKDHLRTQGVDVD